LSEYGTVEIKGLRELDNNLKQLPLKIQKKVLGQAARAGATVIRKEARKNIKSLPEKTGNLRKSITIVKNRRSQPHNPIFTIGPSGKGWYGHLVEYGFCATGPKKKGLTYRESRGRAKKFGKHTPGRPWFRPAFDTTVKKVIEQMGKRLGIAIEREAVKLAR